MTYHEGDMSAGSRGDLVTLLPNHGPGKLIDGLLRLHISDAHVFLELVDRCESTVIAMVRVTNPILDFKNK